MTIELLYKKNVKSENLNGDNKFVVRRVKAERKLLYSIVKRAFDFVCSLLAILVLAIPMLLIGVLIRIDSPGGAVFKQKRVGKNGKEFTLYKFRSMVVDAEKDGAQWAKKNDDRCTKMGHFLRNTRLDELMQLFNILKGDMSIVGPRPERKVFYDEFETYINGFSQRLCVIPGLTGMAQINGGYDLSPERKVALDVEYIEKRSVILDLKNNIQNYCYCI